MWIAFGVAGGIVVGAVGMLGYACWQFGKALGGG